MGADLSWTRLTRWRELLARVFENPAHLARLGGIEELSVCHYGETVPVRALYLAGWLRSSLGNAPTHRFERASRGTPCQPQGEVEAVTLSGPSIRVSIRQLEEETVEVRIDDLVSREVFPVLRDDEMLREELAVTGRADAYEAALERASELVPG